MDNYPDNNKADYATEFKGTTGIKRILNATHYSIDGLKAAWSESAFRQLIYLHTGLLIIVLLLPFSAIQASVLIFASFFSLIVELFNTAIEAAVDHTSLAKHPLAKRAKDTGSAAQMLALIMVILLWIIALVSLAC